MRWILAAILSFSSAVYSNQTVPITEGQTPVLPAPFHDFGFRVSDNGRIKTPYFLSANMQQIQIMASPGARIISVETSVQGSNQNLKINYSDGSHETIQTNSDGGSMTLEGEEIPGTMQLTRESDCNPKSERGLEINGRTYDLPGSSSTIIPSSSIENLLNLGEQGLCKAQTCSASATGLTIGDHTFRYGAYNSTRIGLLSNLRGKGVCNGGPTTCEIRKNTDNSYSFYSEGFPVFQLREFQNREFHEFQNWLDSAKSSVSFCKKFKVAECSVNTQLGQLMVNGMNIFTSSDSGSVQSGLSILGFLCNSESEQSHANSDERPISKSAPVGENNQDDSVGDDISDDR